MNTTKYFNPDDLEYLKTGSDNQIRYDCPFCLEVRGKSDGDFKFYFNLEKQVGFCFKCETTGVPNNLEDDHLHQLGISINKFNSLNDIDNTDVPIAAEKLDFYHMFGKMTDKSLDYLRSRIPFYPDILQNLDIREFNNEGIVFPVTVDNEVVSYCIRYYKPKNKLKYLLPKYIDKFLYSPVHIPKELSIHKNITIVEGVFDSIAATLLGFDYPVCIFGLYLSKVQIKLIKSYNPSSISIFLDDYDKSLVLRNKIKHAFPTIGHISIEKSWGKDPEEILIKRLVDERDKGTDLTLKMAYSQLGRLQSNIND